MNRRTFLCGLTLGTLAPFAVEAQQPSGKVYRMGYLVTPVPPPQGPFWGAFVPKLRDLGYVEGQNLTIELRSAHEKPERLPVLAAELVRRNVDVIVTAGDGEVRAAKQATSVIPIVMAVSGDPVGAGYVASLARPGGNITGQSAMSPDLSAKLLEMLKEAVPTVSRVAVLWNAANPVKVLDFKGTQRAAQSLGLTVHSIEIKTPTDLETALATIARTRPDALLTLGDEVLNVPVILTRIGDFALKQRLPSIGGDRRHAAAGALISYGPSMMEVFRRAATYVDKILKGAKPADLPVEQPTTFELIINLKAAKALGLTIPQWVLGRADQVIE